MDHIIVDGLQMSWPEKIVVAQSNGTVRIATVIDVSEPVHIGDTIRYTITAQLFPTELKWFITDDA